MGDKQYTGELMRCPECHEPAVVVYRRRVMTIEKKGYECKICGWNKEE